MNDLQIPRDKFSQFFWDKLIDYQYTHLSIESELEALREKADYKTGSLNQSDCNDLYSVVRHFKPQAVAEIGTFIGRSTHTIANAMGSGCIWTCDASNDLELPKPKNPSVHIKQFPKTSSTQMLNKAIVERQKFDLFYIDGRLAENDVELIMACEDFVGSVIVLDDFEGIAKGVANASMILNAFAKNGWQQTLIYPRFSGKTALIVPFKFIRFVEQA